VAINSVAIQSSRHFLFIRNHRALHESSQQLSSDAEAAQRQPRMCSNLRRCGRRTTESTTNPAILQALPGVGLEHAVRFNELRLPGESGHLRAGSEFSGEFKCEFELMAVGGIGD
jgi:hypothetical protein